MKKGRKIPDSVPHLKAEGKTKMAVGESKKLMESSAEIEKCANGVDADKVTRPSK